MSVDPSLRFEREVDRSGFVMVPAVVLFDPRISFGAKTVYALLIHHARGDNECFPGQELLAKSASASVRSVRSWLGELEGFGLITIRRKGLNQPNEYVLLDLERLYAGEANIADQDRQPLPPKYNNKEYSSSSSSSRCTSPANPAAPERQGTVHPEELVLSDLSPQEQEVWSILNEVAPNRRTKLTMKAVLSTLRDPKYAAVSDPVQVAKDLAWWTEYGKGSSKTKPDIAGTFRTFMRKEVESTKQTDARSARSRERLARAERAFLAREGKR